MKRNINISIFFFILEIVLSGCATSKKITFEDSKSLIKRISDNTFEIYSTKKAIPKSLMNAYMFLYKNDPNLAEKDSLFNSTDLYSKYVPNRRFVFGGKSYSKTMGFIVFEEGGTIIKSHCLIFTSNNQKVDSLQMIYLNKKPSSLVELKLLLKNEEYLNENVEL